jgi:hypothetical protein
MCGHCSGVRYDAYSVNTAAIHSGGNCCNLRPHKYVTTQLEPVSLSKSQLYALKATCPQSRLGMPPKPHDHTTGVGYWGVHQTHTAAAADGFRASPTDTWRAAATSLATPTKPGNATPCTETASTEPGICQAHSTHDASFARSATSRATSAVKPCERKTLLATHQPCPLACHMQEHAWNMHTAGSPKQQLTPKQQQLIPARIAP